MPIRCSVFVATSLDGFIARADGGIDWLNAPPGEGDGDFGYAAFFATVDVLVMGRRTFEVARGFGAWPYEDRPVIVLSHGHPEVPAGLADRVEVRSGPPAEVLAALEARGLRHAYVDGGATVQAYLRAGRIDEITITRLPVLIGKGIPLFGGIAADIPFEHLGTTAFANGFVQSRYRVVRGA